MNRWANYLKKSKSFSFNPSNNKVSPIYDEELFAFVQKSLENT
jgi:hypothetical protein